VARLEAHRRIPLSRFSAAIVQCADCVCRNDFGSLILSEGYGHLPTTIRVARVMPHTAKRRRNFTSVGTVVLAAKRDGVLLAALQREHRVIRLADTKTVTVLVTDPASARASLKDWRGDHRRNDEMPVLGIAVDAFAVALLQRPCDIGDLC
jgi:hypothetical protein